MMPLLRLCPHCDQMTRVAKMPSGVEILIDTLPNVRGRILFLPDEFHAKLLTPEEAATFNKDIPRFQSHGWSCPSEAGWFSEPAERMAVATQQSSDTEE